MKEKFDARKPILVTKQKKVIEDLFDRKRGIQPVSDFDDYPARRLPKKSGIRLYDVGVLKDENGVETDNVFFAPVAITMTGTSNQGINFGLPTAAQYQAKANAILQQNVETFETKCRLINKGKIASYRLFLRLGNTQEELTSTDPLWSEDGDSLDVSERLDDVAAYFRILSNPHFSATNITGVSQTKVTEEPFYNADAVPFSMLGNEQVFLCPAFQFMQSNTSGVLEQVPISGALPEGSFNSRLFVNYQTFPRIFFAENITWWKNAPLPFAWLGNAITAFYLTLEHYTNWWSIITKMKTLNTFHHLVYQYRKERFREDGALLTETFNTGTHEPTASFPKHLFPAPPALPQPYTDNRDSARAFTAQTGFQTGIGDLTAVIKQNGKFFFCWWTTNN